MRQTQDFSFLQIRQVRGAAHQQCVFEAERCYGKLAHRREVRLRQKRQFANFGSFNVKLANDSKLT